MSAWSFSCSGKLYLLPWSFSRKCANYTTTDYRNRTLAECTCGHAKIRISHNPYAHYWVLSGTCEGFAGPRSKAINAIKTSSERIANKWRAAIETGHVEILERQ